MSVTSYISDLKNLGATMAPLGRANDGRLIITTPEDLSEILNSGNRVFIDLQALMLCLEVPPKTWVDANTMIVWQAHDELGAIFYGNFPGY